MTQLRFWASYYIRFVCFGMERIALNFVHNALWHSDTQVIFVPFFFFRERYYILLEIWLDSSLFIVFVSSIKSYNREAYGELMDFVNRNSLNDADTFCKKLIRESPSHKQLGNDDKTLIWTPEIVLNLICILPCFVPEFF